MQLFFGTIIFITVSVLACGKTMPDTHNDIRQVVKLQAHISHPYGTVPLGDTITLQLTVPDTLITETGDTIPIQTLNKAGCSFFVTQLDTSHVNDSIVYVDRAIPHILPTTWTTNGYTSGGYFDVGITPNVPPYQLTLHFKPNKKGIYSFMVRYPPGVLRANNSSFAAQLYVGFNVPNSNVEWMIPYFGIDYVVAAKQNVAEGFGLYYFKVQ